MLAAKSNKRISNSPEEANTNHTISSTIDYFRHSQNTDCGTSISELHTLPSSQNPPLNLDTPRKPYRSNGLSPAIIRHDVNLNTSSSSRPDRFRHDNETTGSLMNFGLQESANKSLPRKIPSRFWDQEASPGEIDIGQELGDHSLIWERYQTEAKEHDNILSEGWTGDMDVLLVFAALFSAILTAFIIEFYKQLQPDPTSAFLTLSSNMVILLECIANRTECVDISVSPTTKFLPISESYRWINALWFTSLTISLLVSAVAILVKQWVHAYHSGLNGNSKSYGRLRQFRYNGIKKWRMSGIIRALPSLMYLAVILFFVGLLVLLSNLDPTIYFLCLGICVVAGCAYVVTLVSPIIDPSCPFRTPTSRLLDSIYQFIVFYTLKIGLWCIHVMLSIFMNAWYCITEVYSNDKVQRFGSKLIRTLNSLDNQLFRNPTFTQVTEREMEKLDTQMSELDADALAWLSNTNVIDTQDIVMQAVSGLSPNVSLTKFHKAFKSRRPPSSFLIDAYHNPDQSPSYHHRLASYAQAYLMILSGKSGASSFDVDDIGLIRNALQWYPSLTALSAAGDQSQLSEELLSQAIKELGEGFSIITNYSSHDAQEWESSSGIIIDLILQSILLLYLFYADNNSVQSQIVDSSFETLQIWMKTQAVLDSPSRPVYLLSLCCLAQLFSGITSSAQLHQCWFSGDRHKNTWILLLTSLVTLPETEQRQDFPSLSPEHFLTQNPFQGEPLPMVNPNPQPFRHWRLLQCALLDCSTLLSNDRTTFNLVLELFLKTTPESREVWTTEDPFRCLHLIGPLFMPEDTVRVLNLFRNSLEKFTSIQLCKLLQTRCQDLAHAEAVVNSDDFQGVIDDLLFATTADFNALWLLATILQTLSQNHSPVLKGPIPLYILLSIHLVLENKIERNHPQTLWDYYRHWCLPFSLATSCQRLHQTYGVSTAGTGIIKVLRQLSVIVAVSDFRERKEARNFINTVLKLEEWEGECD